MATDHDSIIIKLNQLSYFSLLKKHVLQYNDFANNRDLSEEDLNLKEACIVKIGLNKSSLKQMYSQLCSEYRKLQTQLQGLNTALGPNQTYECLAAESKKLIDDLMRDLKLNNQLKVLRENRNKLIEEMLRIDANPENQKERDENEWLTYFLMDSDLSLELDLGEADLVEACVIDRQADKRQCAGASAINIENQPTLFPRKRERDEGTSDDEVKNNNKRLRYGN